MNSIDAKPGEKYVEGRTLAEAFNYGRSGVKKLFECREKYPELKKKGITNLLTLDLVRYGCAIAHHGQTFTQSSSKRWVGYASPCWLISVMVPRHGTSTGSCFMNRWMDGCRDVVALGGIVREMLNVDVHLSVGIQILLPFSQLPYCSSSTPSSNPFPRLFFWGAGSVTPRNAP